MQRSRLARVGLFLLPWAGLALLNAAQLRVNYGTHGLTWAAALRLSLIDWYAWAALWPLIRVLVRRFCLERGRFAVSVPAHLLASGAIALAQLALFAALDHVTGGGHAPMGQLGTWEVFRGEAMRRTFLGIITYWALVGVASAFDYQRRLRERELRASQLEARLAQARLDLLKMQLHPHFLFNTLHAIATLMHRDLEAAERMITLLSDLLRMSLEHAGAQEVPLRRELDLLAPYLEIERTRFSDRLSVDLEVDPKALDALVPSLILQPLVENAIHHGIAPRAAPGRVEIRARRADGTLELEVRDDGCGPKSSPLEPGVGLGNTRARLEQLYGAKQRLDIEAPRAGGLRVAISIPYRPSHAD